MDKKDTNTKVNIEDLYKYFKRVNAGTNTNPETDDLDTINDIAMDDMLQIKQHLNVNITEAEIAKAAKSLKNNKSPDIDKIMNEHIKESIDKMMPIYLQFLILSLIVVKLHLTGLKVLYCLFLRIKGMQIHKKITDQLLV